MKDFFLTVVLEPASSFMVLQFVSSDVNRQLIVDYK